MKLRKYSTFEELKSDISEEDISEEEKERRHKEVEEFINEIKKYNTGSERSRTI